MNDKRLTLEQELWDYCTPERMAASATRPSFHPEIWVMQPQWSKDFAGQVTDGKIGRPRLAMGPISWVGKQKRDAVLAILRKSVVIENPPFFFRSKELKIWNTITVKLFLNASLCYYLC